LKYEKSNLIYIQTKDNLVILTHKIDILITLTTFLKKCEKSKRGLHTRTEGVSVLYFESNILFYHVCVVLLQITKLYVAF